MTADIVQQLRDDDNNVNAVCWEAADQIERLEAWAKDEQQKRHKAEEDRMNARSEIERLRLALEIAPRPTSSPGAYADWFYKTRISALWPSSNQLRTSK